MLTEEIHRDGVALGGWIQIGHAAIAETFARAGLGWAVIDCEHGIIDLESAASLMRAMARGSCTPLVRVPVNDSAWIARSLDAGARGIVVPMVNTAEQAKAAVAAAKYAPSGRRGFGYCAANAYGVDFDQYAAEANQAITVTVQIEHIEAVENIDRILDVEGVHSVFVGPYDLSGSLDVVGQMDHPKMIAALDRVSRSCQEHNVPAGVHVVQPEPDRVTKAIESGFQIIALSLDAVLLYRAMHDFLKESRDRITNSSRDRSAISTGSPR